MKIYVLMQTDSSNVSTSLKCFKSLDGLCSNLFTNDIKIYVEPELDSENVWTPVESNEELKSKIQQLLKKRGIAYLMYEDSDDWMCVIETNLMD